eukprot:gene10728-12487_t
MSATILSIIVVEAKGLKKKEFGRLDPYVEVKYTNQIYQTKVIKNNSSPIWNDCFEIQLKKIPAPIHLMVWDKEVLFLSNNFIGSASIDLSNLTDQSYDQWFPIERRGKQDSQRGEIRVKISSIQCTDLLDNHLTKSVQVASCLEDDCDHHHQEVEIITGGAEAKERIGQQTKGYPETKGQPTSNSYDELNSDLAMLSHCIQCSKSEKPANLVLMEDCLHNLCRRCLVKGINAQINDNSLQIECIYSSCQEKIPHIMLRDVLGDVEYDRYLNRQLENMEPLLKLKETIQSKAMQRLAYEGLTKCKELEDKSSQWYKNPMGYSMNRYSYVECFKCRSPYFVGQARCGGLDEFNPEDLICGQCKGDQTQKCKIHGSEYMYGV